jgi:hypothetical protein
VSGIFDYQQRTPGRLWLSRFPLDQIGTMFVYAALGHVEERGAFRVGDQNMFYTCISNSANCRLLSFSKRDTSGLVVTLLTWAMASR